MHASTFELTPGVPTAALDWFTPLGRDASQEQLDRLQVDIGGLP